MKKIKSKLYCLKERIKFNKNVSDREYSGLVSCGNSNNNVLDYICAFLLAVSPLLQHYKGIFVNAGVTVLILIFPWIMFRFIVKAADIFRINKLNNLKYIKKFQNNNIVEYSALFMISGLVIFNIYKSFIHDFDFLRFAHSCVVIFYFGAAAFGVINIKKFIVYASRIATAACILIFIQYVCHYIFGFHLQLVPTQLLLPESEQWILGAQTGLAGITGKIGKLYRPSAFFLEPSHMFLYLFPNLFLMLFSPDTDKWKFKKAILFSAGMILSTSGMGILTAGCAWLIYFAFSSGKDNMYSFRNIRIKRNWILTLCCVGAGIIIILLVPFVRSSIMRFLDMSKGGAIAGRSRLAIDLISQMSLGQWFIGVRSTLEGIEFNMPGFFATLYKFGIIGVILSYTAYAYGVIRLRNQYLFISLFVILTSFSSAHTHGTFYMLYFIYFLIEGAHIYENKRTDRPDDLLKINEDGDVNMNRKERLFHTAALILIPSAAKRVNYMKKHNLFGMIGNNVHIQGRILPLYSNIIYIHDNVKIASDVTFITHDIIHKMINCKDGENTAIERIGCIEIMDNVFVGAGTSIMYDTKIGSNVIIAAGSIVTKDIPDNSVYAGVPAKRICSFDDYMEKAEKYAEENSEKYKKYGFTAGSGISSEFADELYEEFRTRKNNEIN